MKKWKKRIAVWCILFTILVSMLLPTGNTQSYQAAASSYNNALEFFHSTDNGDDKHIDVAGAVIYFATHAKLAHTRSGHKYYNTLGYDVTLTAGGKSVTFSVKRGGSLEEVPGSRRVDSNGYEYLLYRIPTQTIINLASLANPKNAAVVLAASKIEVRMDAIVTIRQNQVQGDIIEDGKGGLTEIEPVYHLKNPSHLTKMRDIFSGHMFYSYIEITAPLTNYSLTPIYNVGAATVNNTSYGKGSYSGVSNMLFQNGTLYNKQQYKILQEFKLLDPGKNGLNLSYTGYHLNSGSEWKTSDDRLFSISKTYTPKVVEPSVGFGNKTLVLYANWKPNTYKVIYNANGGTGTMTPSSMVYDTESKLRNITFSREGFYLPAGAEWKDAAGNTYANRQAVKNLTTTNGGEVILYANWQPYVYKITTDKQGGNGGTDSFYQKYATGFFSEEACTNAITGITTPSRTGYTFLGYYSWKNGGNIFVDSSGKIKVENTFFSMDTTAYANWEANKYTVTFDKQGGEYGSDTVIATYDKPFPAADAPVREGYSFKGYYTEAGGNGTRIYNEFMVSDEVYQYDKNITLYAHWMDDVPPQLTLNVSHNTWTNQNVVLTADTWDFGSGLKSLALYRVNVDGSESLIRQQTGTEAKTLQTQYMNNLEGIVRYKAVAVDMSGNTAESYNVVYYDTTKPTGEVVDATIENDKFYFEIDITDIDFGN